MKFPKFAFLFVLIVSAITVSYVATNGTFNFRTPNHLPILFESMWNYFLAGRVDLPNNAGGFESFHIDGRNYVYYGFFPAILRFFLLMIMDYSWYGHLGAISCVLASSVISVFAFMIAFESIKYCNFRFRFIKTAFLILLSLTVVIGSPVVTTAVRNGIWDELVLWGFAFSIIGVYGFIKFIDNRNSDLAIFLLSSAASLAFITRATFGAPLYMLVAVVIFVLIHKRILTLKKMWILSLCIWGMNFQLWYNYVRFGSIFTFVPQDVSHYYFDEVLKHGGILNLDRISELFSYYVFPNFKDGSFSQNYPYFFSKQHPFQDNTIFYPYWCFVVPVSITMPYFLIFPLGAALLFLKNLFEKNKRLVLFMLSATIPLLIEVMVILSYNACFERYKLEFLPLILMCAFFCFRQFKSRMLLLFMFIVCLASCIFTILHTISFQALNV